VTWCRGSGMVAQVGYSVTRRSRGRMMLCVVCIVHVEMSSMGFLVEPQNQGQRFISGLDSKLLGRFVSDLASKPLGRFSPVWPQNRWRRFLPVWPQNRRLWVFWFGPQNRQLRFGPQNRQLQFGDLDIKITTTVS
jgi:hypothetical protein